jgi:CBS domain containing-hemolysin-like protein
MREGKKNARILFNYYRKPERFYWTILLGNTFSNAAFLIVLVLLLKQLFIDITLFSTFFVLGVLVLFIFCDLLPKKLFRRFPNRLCLSVAKPFRIIQITLSPLVSLVYQVFGDAFEGSVSQPLAKQLFQNREELITLMEGSDESLSDQERFMVKQVVQLSDRTLGQIAIPLNLSVTASSDSPISQVVKLCQSRNIGRIPIWKFSGGQRKVIGIVTLKTSPYKEDYNENKLTSDYLQPALFLPSDLKVETALKRMQRTGNWLAIVIGPSQREAGIIALQDILKVIFNESYK